MKIRISSIFGLIPYCKYWRSLAITFFHLSGKLWIPLRNKGSSYEAKNEQRQFLIFGSQLKSISIKMFCTDRNKWQSDEIGQEFPSTIFQKVFNRKSNVKVVTMKDYEPGCIFCTFFLAIAHIKRINCYLRKFTVMV